MTAPAPTGPAELELEDQQVAEGLSPAEQAALVALAAFVAGTATAAAALAALAVLGIPRAAGRAVLSLALRAGRTIGPGPDPTRSPAAANLWRREAWYRAAYLLAAGRRIGRALVGPPAVRPRPRPAVVPDNPATPTVVPATVPVRPVDPAAPTTPAAPETSPDDAPPGGTGIPAGDPSAATSAKRRLEEALERERRFLEQHLEAARRRREMAAQLEAARRKYGRWLIWQAVMDSRTTIDCQRAHLHAFDALNPPRMGIPGAVHPSCRCRVGGRAPTGHPVIGGGNVPPPPLVALAHAAGGDPVRDLTLAERAVRDGTLELARYVRTQAGVARYKRPIGALITDKGGGRAAGPRTASGRRSRALPAGEVTRRALERRRTADRDGLRQAGHLGTLNAAQARTAMARLTQPELYAARRQARARRDQTGNAQARAEYKRAAQHVDRELARRADARVRGMSDDRLQEAFTSSVARNRVAEIDRFLAEMDRRQRAEQTAERRRADNIERGKARRAAEQAARDREEERRAAEYERLLDQGLDDESAVAEAYGVSVDRQRRQAAIARLRAEQHQGKGFDELARSAFRAHVDRAYLAAEDATRGTMLSNAARARGVDPASLFIGSEARARRLASPELLEHWDEVGRMTFDEFVDQELNDPASAARRRAARGDFYT